MSDTCIVCLGDLGESQGSAPALPTPPAKSPKDRTSTRDGLSTDTLPPATTSPIDGEKPTLVAYLQPCGHYLHNDCLTPWVERANSCPICRQSFLSVELRDKVGGNVTSSYAVQDKTQVAEFDPSLFAELPESDLDDQPCQVCGEDDNEDLLMYCDSCQKLWHTYCVHLQEVPHGHWFCDHCRAQRGSNPHDLRNGGARSHRPSSRRTRGQQRRQRSYHLANDASYREVWQSVWDRINLDLDFPYDEEGNAATYMRHHRQSVDRHRREHDAWQRRQRVAELQGAGARFRETEATILDRGMARSLPQANSAQVAATAEPENEEEIAAWQAFDQAIAADNIASTLQKRKRKSRTTSPAEAESSDSERASKRARSSQPRDLPEAPVRSATASRRRTSLGLSPSSTRVPNPNLGPSFLQSLLKEVEDSSIPGESSRPYRPSPINGPSPAAEQQSPRPSSPALSPLPSNHSSPRAMSATPPPYGHGRPSSPTGLSSSIQPVFPLAEISSSRTSPEPPNHLPRNLLPNGSRTPGPPVLAQPQPRLPRAFHQSSPPPSRPRSNEASPTRPQLSYNAKSDVQKMVSAALKPFYNDQVISKDEYTAVNRDTCHILYSEIGDFEALDVEGRARWEKIATEKVAKAVSAMKRIAVDASGRA